MTPILILVALRGAASRALGLWSRLPGPVKAIILIALAYLAGYSRGVHHEHIRCEARINASIAEAKSIDAAVSRSAEQQALIQAADAAKRAAEMEAQLHEFAATATDRLAECQAGADADRLNGASGVRLGPEVPEPRAEPARRGRRGAHPVPLPQGSRER